jgi:hypothetical protein
MVISAENRIAPESKLAEICGGYLGERWRISGPAVAELHQG